MPATLLSLGSINADFQMRVDAPPGSADMLSAHDLWRLGGGKAGNVAYLARLLGCDARLYGRVGSDDLAAQALAPLRRAGVDLSGVARTDGATGLAVVLVPPSGTKQIILAENANTCGGWRESELAALAWHISKAPAPAILVINYEVSAEAVRCAVTAARQHGIRVVIDPAAPERAERDILALADAVTPNQTEACRLAGLHRHCDVEAVARALAELGPAIVCIKLDGGGCLLVWEGELTRIASAAANVVDTTGAGDAFTGALAVALLEGLAPPEAAVFAVAASDLSVAGYGAQPSFASRERTEAQAEAVRRVAQGGHAPARQA